MAVGRQWVGRHFQGVVSGADLSPHATQDVARVFPERARVVVADGAGDTGAAAGEWAGLLTLCYASSREAANAHESEWLRRAVAAWSEASNARMLKGGVASLNPEELGLVQHGVSASFVGASFEDQDGVPAVRWVAAGDCEAMLFREGRLLEWGPIDDWHDFSTVASGLNSLCAHGQALHGRRWELEDGDVLLLSSDALARFILRACGDGGVAPAEVRALMTCVDWEVLREYVEEWRRGDLENDDVALVRVTIQQTVRTGRFKLAPDREFPAQLRSEAVRASLGSASARVAGEGREVPRAAKEDRGGPDASSEDGRGLPAAADDADERPVAAASAEEPVGTPDATRWFLVDVRLWPFISLAMLVSGFAMGLALPVLRTRMQEATVASATEQGTVTHGDLAGGGEALSAEVSARPSELDDPGDTGRGRDGDSRPSVVDRRGEPDEPGPGRNSARTSSPDLAGRDRHVVESVATTSAIAAEGVPPGAAIAPPPEPAVVEATPVKAAPGDSNALPEQPLAAPANEPAPTVSAPAQAHSGAPQQGDGPARTAEGSIPPVKPAQHGPQASGQTGASRPEEEASTVPCRLMRGMKLYSTAKGETNPLLVVHADSVPCEIPAGDDESSRRVTFTAWLLGVDPESVRQHVLTTYANAWTAPISEPNFRYLGNLRAGTTFTVGRHLTRGGDVWLELQITAFRGAQ